VKTGQESTSGLPTRRSLTLIYVLSLLIALLMAAASAIGLLYHAAIYPSKELFESFVSNDIVNLLIGLPILLGSMWWARRGKLLGLLLWPGAQRLRLDDRTGPGHLRGAALAALPVRIRGRPGAAIPGQHAFRRVDHLFAGTATVDRCALRSG
jgi:hypothetical protein